MRTSNTDILVVDDQLGVRLLLSVALSEEGFQISTAANGAEGVLLAKELQPKLIIMDIKMPVKDGITALFEIKKENPQIKVVMMTAYEERDTIKKVEQGGAEGYVLKPFDIEKFVSYIKEVYPLNGQAYA